jgi:ribosomal protein L30
MGGKNVTGTKNDKPGKVKVRQTGSAIRRDKKQALYLKSLGLSGIGTERELTASHAVLELIKKVSHMVKII